MMRNFVAFLCVLALVFPCFAGGYVEVDAPFISAHVKSVAPDNPISLAPIETKVIERIIEKAPAKPTPSKGLAIGLHGFYPTIAYVGTDLEIEAGYTSRFSDQSAMIRGAGVAWASADRYTLLKAGFSVFPGTVPMWGIYGEVEQFLTSTISFSGAIYPIKSGSQTILGDGVVSARIYL